MGSGKGGVNKGGVWDKGGWLGVLVRGVVGVMGVVRGCVIIGES